MKVLRTPFYEDVPRAFRVKDVTGVSQVVGAYAQTIAYFAKYKSYDLQLIEVDDVKVSEFQRGIQNGLYNISMHPTATRTIFANVTFSYPMEWSRTCIMVSSEEELPSYWYVLWPFGRYIWMLIGITIVYVAYLMRWLKHPTPNATSNLLTSLAVIIHSPNMCLKMTNAVLRLQLFYSLLLLMGFVLNSYHCSYLSAYNMRPVFQPFLRTVDELVKADQKVWISSNLLEALQNDPNVNLSPLKPVLEEKPRSQIGYGMQNLYRSFAVAISHSDWKFMQKIQRGLIQPIYQLSDVCFGNFLNAFPVQLDSKFITDLNYFVLLVQQSGLWDIWEEEAFTAAVRSNLYHRAQDSYTAKPLNLFYYRIAWIILFGGFSLSLFCIIGEVVAHNHQSKIQRIRSATSMCYVGDW